MVPTTEPLPSGRPSFLDAPRSALPDLAPADLAVLGVPFTTPHDWASARAPCSPAPDAIRQQSVRLAGTLEHYDFDFGGELLADRRVRLVDAGDAPARPGRAEESAGRAAAAVGALVARGALPVVLGGDHAAALPAIRACASRAPLGILHLGARLDWRDTVEGVAGSAPSVMRRAAEHPGVLTMAQVGLRGPGGGLPGDVAAARAFGSVLVPATEVHEDGTQAALGRLPPAPGYFLSLDVGALDPAVAPGVDLPAFGGLTYLQVTALLRGLAARTPVVGMALVGVVPGLDLHDRTSLLAARLILTLLGALAQAGRIGEPAVAAGRPDRREARAPVPVLG